MEYFRNAISVGISSLSLVSLAVTTAFACSLVLVDKIRDTLYCPGVYNRPGGGYASIKAIIDKVLPNPMSAEESDNDEE